MVVLRPILPEPMIALLQHRDIGDAVLLGEVIGRGETMPAADDDHVVVTASARASATLGLQPRLPASRCFTSRRRPSSAWPHLEPARRSY